MSAFRKASVYVRDTFAGILMETDNGYAFAYDANYLASPDAAPVSLTLLLQEAPFESKTLFLQAQASKKILFLDIFVGARGVLSCSTDGWYWSLYKGATGTYDSGVCNSGGGANAQFDFANIQPQIYAGVGLKFLCLELDASVCADISSGFKNTTGFIWSGALSLHASL